MLGGRRGRGSPREQCSQIREKGAGERGSAKRRHGAAECPDPGGDPCLRRDCPSLQQKDKVCQHPPRGQLEAPRGDTREPTLGLNIIILWPKPSLPPVPHPAPVDGKTEAWSPERAGCSRALREAVRAVVSAKFPEPCASRDRAAEPPLRSGDGAARRLPVT